MSHAARRPRLATPDVARGFMLLLIAVANVPSWPLVDVATADHVDTAWWWTRQLLVDQRSYPLFAILLGFGMATMAAGHQRRLGHLGAPARRRGVRVLLRRRGLTLLGLGGVHVWLFSGDVLGSYGFITLLLAGAIAARHREWLLVIGAATAASAATVAWSLSQIPWEDMPLDVALAIDPFTDVVDLEIWAMAVVFSPLVFPLVPCIVIGALIARSGILARVRTHRFGFMVAGVSGLAVGAATGTLASVWGVMVPLGTEAAGVGGMLAGVGALVGHVGTYFSATGWLLLCAAAVGWGWWPAAQRWLAAIGRRSLSAYVAQSVVFLLGVTLPAMLDMPWFTHEWHGALAGLGCWFLIGWGCWALERAGLPGPLEPVARRLTYGPRGHVVGVRDGATTTPASELQGTSAS